MATVVANRYENLEASAKAACLAPVFEGPAALLGAVKKVTAKIAQRVDEIEEGRSFPRDLFEEVKATGLFQMMIARQYGGAEYSLPDALAVIEEFGRVDGSAAWSMMLGSEIHIAWARFPADVLREVYKSDSAPMTRGALTPKGKVTKVDGGFVLDGQWPLASGSYPTDWFLVGGMVSDSDGRPIVSPDGIIDIMLSAVPSADVEVLDTWHSMGLRATESHDIRFDKYFVPDRMTAYASSFDTAAGPIGRIPIYSALGTFHLGVLLGIARGMLDELAASSKLKRPMLSPKILLSQSALFQKRFAALEVRLASARAFVMNEATNIWNTVNEGNAVTPLMSARYRSMVAHVHQECLAIANDVFSDAGTASLYDGSSMQRRFRDMRSACQHVIASSDIYQPYGALLLNEAVEFNGKI